MKIKFLDIAAIIFVAALAAASLLPTLLKKDGTTLEIVTDNGVRALSLDHDGVYPLDSHGYTLTLEIVDKSARITSHTCPDGLCAAMGSISRAGETIICLPAEISVRVLGESGEVLDGIAG